MTSYATLLDVRTYGIAATSAEDDLVQDRLSIASRIVDDYTGTSFAAAAARTVTVQDVRIPLLPLPTPFSTITEVTINGQAIGSDRYEVEDWGLRLYRA